MTEEIERLRAELAAERERGDRIADEAEKLRQELAEWVNYWRYADLKAVTAERDALRVLLREAADRLPEHVRARIDAALKGDGDDGNA